MANTKHIVVREYQNILDAEGLTSAEAKDLRDFVLDSLGEDGDGNLQSILQIQNKQIKAKNHVGALTTNKDTVIEILPKIDLCEDDDVQTRKYFLQMLTPYLGSKHVVLNDSYIDKLKHFPMLEVFYSLFLAELQEIIKRGPAKTYEVREQNLPYLKGKILFPQHIRDNMVNQERFYVERTELTSNRPANRLIRSAIDELLAVSKNFENKKVLRQLQILFADIPKSTNYQSDWSKHQINRMMTHYEGVMQWVGLFLFGHGLATFSGAHKNKSLLFPMHRVFESFVGHHFKKYQYQNHQLTYRITLQGPIKKLLEGQKQYSMRPDITIKSIDGAETYALDTKWKHITDPKRDISQGDLYQLYAYGKKYGCRVVALIYPKSAGINAVVKYRYDSSLELLCFPFDVSNPTASISNIFSELLSHRAKPLSAQSKLTNKK